MSAECRARNADCIAPDSRDHTGRRLGMTLFELLLVLVLLVVVGSLAAPLFEGSFSSIRLRRGTDQILAAWAQARTHSIEAGQIYQFRFRPKASAYRMETWSGGLEVDKANLAEAAASSPGSQAEKELVTWTLENSLPEGITFSSAERVFLEEIGGSSVERLDQNQSDWSTPILFFPDGTTSPATLLLQNGKGLFRRATLRALTGVARSSDLLTQDEVDRLQAR